MNAKELVLDIEERLEPCVEHLGLFMGKEDYCSTEYPLDCNIHIEIPTLVNDSDTYRFAHIYVIMDDDDADWNGEASNVEGKFWYPDGKDSGRNDNHDIYTRLYAIPQDINTLLSDIQSVAAQIRRIQNVKQLLVDTVKEVGEDMIRMGLKIDY